jgi:hypothetical protein
VTAGPGGLALCLALPALGSGPMGGDAAAYAAQAASGTTDDRWTHAGYLLPAALLAGLRPETVLLAMDLASWVSALLLVGVVASRVERAGGDGVLGGLGLAAVVLPWAPFAEVDLPWMAALSLGVPWAALAVAISPVALLALPGLPDLRRLGWALGAVALLTWLSRGDWWWGERGVLSSPGPMPGRTLQATLLHLPWPVILLSPRAALPLLASGLPLLLVPPDVPAWALTSARLVEQAARAPHPWLRWAVALQLVLGAGEGAARLWKVRQENAVVTELSSQLGPQDGLVAPWSWGARVAVAKSGDPYGIPWHPPGRWLRDQHRQWCEARPTRIFALPPDESGQIPQLLQDEARCP